MKFDKIAICGSHSCGKTTLVNELKKHMVFETHPLINELAANFPPNTRLSMDTQFKIMQQQVITEITCVKNFGKFLSDRSVIDNLAYSTLVNKTHRNDSIYRKCIALSYSHLYSFFPPYDLLIFVDEVLPYKNAAHRNFDTESEQQFIYHFIGEELLKLKIPVICVLGDTSKRIDTILEFIKENQDFNNV